MGEEPLLTSDPNHPGNLTDEEYERQHQERAARLGDSGLHVVPQVFIDQIGGQQ